MNRLIYADALKDEIRKYANEPSKIRDRRWDTRCTAIIADMLGTVDKATTIDAIPVDWLERRLNETVEATAQGDDQTELNHAIFTVLVDWERGRLKNGKAGH